MIWFTLLLVLLVLASLWASMASALLRATLGLALTSALLSVVMFAMGATLAAVIELSVCAGLISVVLVSVTSLTQPRTFREALAQRRARLRRFWPLPFVLLAAGKVSSSSALTVSASACTRGQPSLSPWPSGRRCSSMPAALSPLQASSSRVSSCSERSI